MFIVKGGKKIRRRKKELLIDISNKILCTALEHVTTVLFVRLVCTAFVPQTYILFCMTNKAPLSNQYDLEELPSLPSL
jgi:hypothetical protein